MKKIFLTLVLFFGISVSSSINVYADEIVEWQHFSRQKL